MKTLTNRSIHLKPQAPPINKVMGYKNEAVVKRLEKDLKLRPAAAQQLFQDMLRFLYISRATDVRPISPPHMIDEAWHTFIIYTKDYLDFCFEYFDEFIHHRPHRPGEKHGGEGGENCRKLAKLFFGDSLSENWGPKNSKTGDECSYCSSKPETPSRCDSSCREECCI